ncbi:GntR family transcriptional regulator [Pseudomonas putida]|uniref:GntR family transcriptional regulator n=1 Tax=Pseudomonas putida TaxID=303 RepID=UPI0018D6C319|nr:GntR family transcriptional regulator [Pseudomonas putida]MBH3470587.1 GntR family transcriptional regulator [Pseudomonas putida]
MRTSEQDKGAGAIHALLEHVPPVDRTSSLPLWVQIKERLLGVILDASVQANARLPSENTLCDLLGVSRPIIRMALDALVTQGLISKVPRQGIFVSQKRQEVDYVSHNKGLFGEIAKGYSVTTKVLLVERASPTEDEVKKLQLPPPADVLRVRRIYYVDGVATAVSTLRLAGHRVPGIEDWIKDSVSVYGIMQERFSLIVTDSERWFEAVMPTREEAELLGITTGQPLIGIESIGRTKDGLPIEYYNTVYSTTKSRLRVTAG